MDDQIKYALNEVDTKRIVRKPVHVVGAMNKDSLISLLTNNEPILRIMLHYQNSDSGNAVSGHWCSLYVDKNRKKIYFYDSYGEYPDDQLTHIKPSYRRRTEQGSRDINTMLNAALRAGYKIEYNHYKHQQLKDGVNTCGRWAAMFLKRGESIENFNKFIRQYARIYGFKNLDDAIVDLTQSSLIY